MNHSVPISQYSVPQECIPIIEEVLKKQLGYRVSVDEILIAPRKMVEFRIRQQIVRFFTSNFSEYGQEKITKMLADSQKSIDPSTVDNVVECVEIPVVPLLESDSVL